MKFLAERKLVFLLAVLLAIVGVGCGSDSQPEDVAGEPPSEAAPERGGRLVMAVPMSEPDAFLPLMLESLTTFAADGSVVPFLAESVEPNSTFDRWTITLRPGLSFHNGESLDAEALKANLDTYSTSPVYGTDPFAPITATTVVDDLTVEVELDRPWASFPAHLTAEQAKGVGLMVAPETLEKMGSLFLADPFSADVHGTGPFTYDDAESADDRRHFLRNPEYWQDGLPYLEEVEIQVVPDQASRLSSLDTGDVDVAITGRPPEASGDYQVLTQEGDPEVLAVALNTQRAPLDDPSVREALAAATDVEALAGAIGVDRSEIAAGPFGPASQWSDPNATPVAHDLERARELVAAYENANGPIRIELGAQEVEIDSLEVHRQLAEQWTDAGIEVELGVMDPFARTFTLLVEGDFDAVLEGLFGMPEPDMYYFWWHSSALQSEGKGIGYNYVGIDDPALDEALDSARATLDTGPRQEAMLTVQERLADATPYLWLWAARSSAVSSPRVHGLDAAPLPDGGTRWPMLGRGLNLGGAWLEQ